MSIRTYETYKEIKNQTGAWEQAIDRIGSAQLPDLRRFDEVVFTGCGSTYYLSLAGSALFQMLTQIPSRGIPAGELLLNPDAYLSPKKTLLISVSRSGTTTETLRAVEGFRSSRAGEIITISAYDRALSALGDVNISIPQGQERSVAQTRSFSAMYLAVVALSVTMAGRADLRKGLLALPEIGERLMEENEDFARELGQDQDYDRYYFLGSGIRYGLACEVNLKMKEMTLTHSEPFHFLEYRHGPMSMVNPKAVVIGLVSDRNYSYEMAVLEEMKKLGARVVSLGEENVEVPFHSNLPEPVRAVLYLPLLQLMAYYRSLAKNCNPDHPQNLSAVVELDI